MPVVDGVWVVDGVPVVDGLKVVDGVLVDSAISLYSSESLVGPVLSGRSSIAAIAATHSSMVNTVHLIWAISGSNGNWISSKNRELVGC